MCLGRPPPKTLARHRPVPCAGYVGGFIRADVHLPGTSNGEAESATENANHEEKWGTTNEDYVRQLPSRLQN